MSENEEVWYEIVLQSLTGYDHVPVDQTTFEICVPCKDETGFSVHIVAGSSNFAVYHDFWHEEYEDIHEALCYFLLGLTAAERLKVTSRGNCACRWEVETNVEGEWGSIGITGLFLYPYWRRPRTRFLQNDWIAVEALHEWIPDRFTTCRIDN
jgi:hypothetical protein